MKTRFTLFLISTVFVLTGCAAGGGVGEYGMGDESAAIKSARNRESARVSRAELDQHRRQRTNASEEIDLANKRRRAKSEEINDTLGTVNNATNVLHNLRWLGRSW